mmetsp:Transcript_24562/g.36042  ORF Transcript_24562/g.36042 Transcript_24562/m.36042 type:complete len:107 (-) Transcript_24562:207-527(-)
MWAADVTVSEEAVATRLTGTVDGVEASGALLLDDNLLRPARTETALFSVLSPLAMIPSCACSFINHKIESGDGLSGFTDRHLGPKPGEPRPIGGHCGTPYMWGSIP